MSKTCTHEVLAALSVHDRAELYANACRLGHTAESAALKQRIEDAGLPYSEDAALKGDDPITRKMTDIIYSPEGRAAALKGQSEGLPAMAGIDPLLQIALGSDYGPHNRGTIKAGEIMGALMRSLGFRKGPEKELPPHCVAKTAATWL